MEGRSADLIVCLSGDLAPASAWWVAGWPMVRWTKIVRF